ncbi:sugar ABC transporter substrate-binding protein [Dethiosulfatarculus sandiegensis]|uniref:LacI family transcriptional regulator n=1 Tax=Dethiosulfatarculus sandiegensis TaxID=1429043 RepID=A0A0D2JTB9_9BACT|nr:sugar ABC transporter substrate-binding protein [Dethiosulfatarculus sandiegensis]KIX12745.1 LacI family transcriptional regulator [Dethiosulfatarculus sandiegensis]
MSFPRIAAICCLLAAALFLAAPASYAADKTKIGVIAFQMSSETHARTAKAAEKAAKALGWDVTLLNSRGSLTEHAAQLENLIQAKVNGIVVCMGKPVQFDGQFEAAKKAGIPVITVMSGTSPHTLFEITVNEYQVGAQAALYLLGCLNYQGNIMAQRFESHVGCRIRGKLLDVVLSENKAVKVIGNHTMARTKSWREDVKNGMEALILKNQGKFQGIWASFDAQAFIIDDILSQQGIKKGDIALVSIDGGQEVFRRIRDPKSLMTATVAIPFEIMGEKAVESMDQILNHGKTKEDLVQGPYMLLDAVLVDKNNVPEEGKWPF